MVTGLVESAPGLTDRGMYTVSLTQIVSAGAEIEAL